MNPIAETQCITLNTSSQIFVRQVSEGLLLSPVLKMEKLKVRQTLMKLELSVSKQFQTWLWLDADDRLKLRRPCHPDLCPEAPPSVLTLTAPETGLS